MSEGLKPCNDLIVHRRRDGFSQTRSSPSVWRQFRSPPSRSQTRLACIHVSSHRTCEPPSCACVAPSSYPASLITTRRTESTLASVDFEARHTSALAASFSLTALVIANHVWSRHAHPSSLPCAWYISKLLACPRMPVAAFHNSIHSNILLAACKK